MHTQLNSVQSNDCVCLFFYGIHLFSQSDLLDECWSITVECLKQREASEDMDEGEENNTTKK